MAENKNYRVVKNFDAPAIQQILAEWANAREEFAGHELKAEDIVVGFSRDSGGEEPAAETKDEAPVGFELEGEQLLDIVKKYSNVPYGSAWHSMEPPLRITIKGYRPFSPEINKPKGAKPK